MSDNEMTHDESGLDEFHPDTTHNASTQHTPEFSRRVNVFKLKDEPKGFEEWHADGRSREADDFNRIYMDNRRKEYTAYLASFQPYRWHAKAMNGEVVAHGESYFNEKDRDDNIALNYGDDTTVYTMPMYGEDRSEKLLRYGATDRNAIGRLGVVDNGGRESDTGEVGE